MENKMENKMENMATTENKIAFDFGKANIPFEIEKGFSEPEGTHRWTNGLHVLFRPKITRQIDKIVFYGLYAHLRQVVFWVLEDSATDPEAKDIVQESGTLIMSEKLHSLVIPFPARSLKNPTIRLHIPCALSPSELKLNQDSRLLGVAFRSGVIVFRKKPVLTSETPLEYGVATLASVSWASTSPELRAFIVSFLAKVETCAAFVTNTASLSLFEREVVNVHTIPMLKRVLEMEGQQMDDADMHKKLVFRSELCRAWRALDFASIEDCTF